MRKVSLPEGKQGSAEIYKFNVNKDQEAMQKLRGAINGTGRWTRAGDYTGLKVGGELMMSDTVDEMEDHQTAVWAAEAGGHVLLAGLGLGMILQSVAELPQVTKVTVLELNQDVVDLVWPTYKERYGDKIELVVGDATEYEPPEGIHYGTVWFDIWPTICMDNWKIINRLNDKYNEISNWADCWSRDILEDQYDEEYDDE